MARNAFVGAFATAVIAAFVCGSVAAGCAAKAVHSTASIPARSVVVGCADSVYGQLAPDWRSPKRGTVVAGPIAWPYLRANRSAASTFAPDRGLAPGEKALAVVDVGSSIIVSIPRRERARLSLDYTNLSPRSVRGDQRALFRVSDGASSVTFRPCTRAESMDRKTTQFAGGFIVKGAQCAEIDIRVTGTMDRFRRYIPFGVPARRC
jgi:hypothetical protein